MDEKEKYESIWKCDAYRLNSPGERKLGLLLSDLENREVLTLIDLGCGTGRASLKLDEAGYDVTMVDIAENCLDMPVEIALGHKLLVQPLWQDIPGHYDYGYCCDVMEHLPTDKVPAVLEKIAAACDRVYFDVCLSADGYGPRLIGEPLHLTVASYDWWMDSITRYFDVDRQFYGPAHGVYIGRPL